MADATIMVQAFDASNQEILSPNQAQLDQANAMVQAAQPAYFFTSVNLSPTQKFLLYGVTAYVIYKLLMKGK